MFMGPRNWFQGINSTSLCSLAGRYDNPITIPPRFLAPIDFLKILALFWSRNSNVPCFHISNSPALRYTQLQVLNLWGLSGDFHASGLTTSPESKFWEGLYFAMRQKSSFKTGFQISLSLSFSRDQSRTNRLIYLFWQKLHGFPASKRKSFLSESELWLERKVHETHIFNRFLLRSAAEILTK